MILDWSGVELTFQTENQIGVEIENEIQLKCC